MTQSDRRIFLIKYFTGIERQGMKFPPTSPLKKNYCEHCLIYACRVKRGKEFLNVQNAYLKTELNDKGITEFSNLAPKNSDVFLWQGDIITLKCDCIVNAANCKMLGCFCPNHNCIDNAMHTFAGVQLCSECYEIMKAQGHDEEAGRAKITSVYNLPCNYILHTVGPTVNGNLTLNDEEVLISCYCSCLAIAEKRDIKSIAFCCISTGEFKFPNLRAAELAVQTVTEFKKTLKVKSK